MSRNNKRPNVHDPIAVAGYMYKLEEENSLLKNDLQYSLYLLLEKYTAGIGHGWEDGLKESEVDDMIICQLFNHELDPNLSENRNRIKRLKLKFRDRAI